MKSINDMSVTEAASLALELVIYGDYLEAQKKRYEWREPFEGTFDDYLVEYWTDDEDQWEPSEEKSEPITDFDTDRVWQNKHGEGSETTRDGLTGKVVDSYGGEGEGDRYWMVISLSDGLTTRYFRRDGWYASYDGGYLDGETYEVKPKTKQITVFE